MRLTWLSVANGSCSSIAVSRTTTVKLLMKNEVVMVHDSLFQGHLTPCPLYRSRQWALLQYHFHLSLLLGLLVCLDRYCTSLFT